jgi:hypothetical protein
MSPRVDPTCSRSLHTLGLGAALLGLVALIVVTGADRAQAQPGTPVYQQTVNDCVTGDHFVENQKNNQPDAGCDDYATDYYERPFNNSDQDHFFPDLDIVQASLGVDATWFYCRVDLFGRRDGTKLDALYACELDTDGDGRFDYLITATSPTSNVGTSFGASGVIAWSDGNNDVGDGVPLAADPPQAGNGYDTKVSDQSCGHACARIDPTDPTRVEIAFRRSLVGNPATVRWRAWAEKGLQDPQNWLHHDKYTAAEAGSPYVASASFPTQNIYEDDNTCGVNLTGPNSCPVLSPGLITITVEKETSPAGTGQAFDFTIIHGGASCTVGGTQVAAFALQDGQSQTTQDNNGGMWRICEALPAGWTLTGATCTGGPFGAGGGPYTNGTGITLTPGDSISCVFANTQQTGSITVDKVTVPGGSAQLFAFTVAGGAVSDAFQLADATAPHTTSGLAPGGYTITETVPSGWDLTGATCTGGPFGAGAPYTNGATIAVAAGDAITCTFENTEQPPAVGSITVDKVTVPAASAQLFTFTVAGGAISDGFELADATAPHTTANLAPGTYTITETVPAGWDLTGATCAGGPFGAGAPYTNGATIAVAGGDAITCTFTNTRQGAAVGSLTVDKVTVPAGLPALFEFTVAGPAVDDVFSLAHATAPHTTANLSPGTYTVTETPAAGFTTTAFCTGGPFGAGAAYTSGAPIALDSGQAVTCTFTNTLRSTAGFCPTASVTKILARRFPGARGMDLVVRTDLGEWIQDGIDAAGDFNGDGYILVGVQGRSTSKPGGHTDQNFVVDGVYARPFGLVGCSVTVHDPLPGDGVPPAHIAASASAPSLFVMGLYAADSRGPGWLVEGHGRYIYSVNATDNATGIWVIGDDNTVDLGQFRGNAGAGVLVDGHSNVITGVISISNSGPGVQVGGDGNTVESSRIGERLQGNGGDGVRVQGAGNLVVKNLIHANTGDGIDVSGGGVLGPNVLRQNVVGDWAKGNAGHGIHVHHDGGDGTLDRNTVRANGQAGILITGGTTGHKLSRNVSGGTVSLDNGDCEFDVSAGNLNKGGNKANALTVPALAGGAFPAGCTGTP